MTTIVDGKQIEIPDHIAYSVAMSDDSIKDALFEMAIEKL